MANNLILTKESSESEIKAYFEAVLKLSESDNEFPINFDEVWMLVYEDKRSAIHELKDKFLQNVDYQTVRKKVQASNVAGYVWSDSYYLTVSCMEFFIARKIRPVFEVYRAVFHKTAKAYIEQKEPTASDRMMAAEWAAKFLNLNENSKLAIAKDVLEPYHLPLPDYTSSKGILKSATELLNIAGLGKRITAQMFNKRAVEKGYLCDMERNSSRGQKKHFKSISSKSLEYGENQVNPNNPKSTQPLWYADKFSEFLSVLGFNVDDSVDMFSRKVG